jgi:glycosyltransferase involved in cell wall biosynthesis
MPDAGARPSISVVIPTYDRGQAVESAIRSALEQSCPPLEVIVVDDGSRDATCDVVAGIDDPGRRIRYVRQENRGVAAARNRGVHAARGDWIAFLDSDDVWLPKRIAHACDLMAAEPDAEFLHCEICYRTVEGAIEQRRRRSAAEMVDRAFLLENLWTWTSSLMVRRSLLDRVRPLFAEWLRTCSDFELWWRLIATARGIAFSPSVDVIYCKTPGSLSDGESDKLRRDGVAARGSAARWMAANGVAREYVEIMRREQFCDYRDLLRGSLRAGLRAALVGDLRTGSREFSAPVVLRALASSALANGREQMRTLGGRYTQRPLSRCTSQDARRSARSGRSRG